ncbi:Omp85 domain-containing protein [Pseudomonas sp. IT-P258]
MAVSSLDICSGSGFGLAADTSDLSWEAIFLSGIKNYQKILFGFKAMYPAARKTTGLDGLPRINAFRIPGNRFGTRNIRTRNERSET